MIAPTSHERIRIHCRRGQAALSTACPLWASPECAASITTDIGAMVKLVKADKGYSLPLSASASPLRNRPAEMAQKADGVIVGSAIVKLIAVNGRDSVEPVTEYVKAMKDAIR